ncbi:MAG: HAD family hydrolase [Propionibacterium sp.]
MKSLLATDLDGTVVFGTGVTARDALALRKWRAAGNCLVLDTGKSLDAVREVWHNHDLPLPDYVIAFTGAVIADGELNPLVTHSHDAATLATVASVLTSEQVALYASDIERDYEVVNRVGRTSVILPRFRSARLSWLEGRRLYGIPVFVPDAADRDRITTALENALGDTVRVHRNQDFLDIVPSQMTKGRGLRRLLDELIPDHGTVITLGDSWNDLSMHAEADLAVAMRHSPPDVIARCDKVVGSAAELIDELLQENS